jgi:Cft2 family RNA processing exonuclease
MQELLQLLYEAKIRGKLVDSPIFCSGLGMSLAGTFDLIGKRVKAVRFKRSILKTLGVRSLPRKKFIPGVRMPATGIYLLSSGMLVENTPSYNVGACLIHNGKNTICFVGYCDPDTPGGKLLRTQPNEEFLFEGLNYQARLKASIHHFDLSGHADREELLTFATHCKARDIVLTHGDGESRRWFLENLAKANEDHRFRIWDPNPTQVYDLTD